MLDTNDFIKDLNKIMEEMTSNANSPFVKTRDYINSEFDKFNLSNDKRMSILANLMSELTIAFTTKSADVAVQLQQVRAQVELSNAEIEFNKSRTKLIDAQVLTEEKKRLAVDRQIKSYDDNLRVKKAETIKDAVFGYAAGGLDVPQNLTTKMLNEIDAIIATPQTRPMPTPPDENAAADHTKGYDELDDE